MASQDFSSLFGNLFGDSFSNLLGGTASLPNIKSTSQYLPLQDTLFNAFQNRQSIFSPSVPASGSYDASFASPFGQEGLNGGLRWSYDPNWMTGIPRPAPVQSYSAPSLTETLSGGGGRRRADVHGGPAQEVIEADLTKPPVLPPSPGSPPPPRNEFGYWEWGWDSANPGQGTWNWIQGAHGGERRQGPRSRIEY